MAAPTRIYDISTTAASNFPTGSEAVGTSLDDYLRAIQTVYRLDLASKGNDIASAATTDLGAVGGLFHDITGTTTITGFGTVAAGVWKVIKFEGALTLTHNSTSLILPGGANITTVAGDIAVVTSEGSGNWRCVSYTRGANPPSFASASDANTGTDNTKALSASSVSSWAPRVLLEEQTASNSASLDFLTGIGADYDHYELEFLNVLPETDAQGLRIRVSTDGSTFISTATYVGTTRTRTSAAADGGVEADPAAPSTGMWVTGSDVSNSAARGGVSGTVKFYNVNQSDHFIHFIGDSVYPINGATVSLVRANMGWWRNVAAAISGVQVIMESGNLVSGTVRLYGVRT